MLARLILVLCMLAGGVAMAQTPPLIRSMTSGSAAPVRVKGELQLVEKVDPKRFDFISTNNITFALEPILAGEIALPYRVMRKTVDGKDVFQLELVTAEASGLRRSDGKPLLPFAFVSVPRAPASVSRFEPVKALEDLAPAAESLAQRLAKQA